MEAILLGIAIGAGAVLALKNGRERGKKLVGWAARHAGTVSGQVNAAVEAARRVAREQYAKGREDNLAKIAEMPPLSTRPAPAPAQPNGVAGVGRDPHPSALGRDPSRTQAGQAAQAGEHSRPS
jgi:hypothetical protein